ncbi:2-oxoglutarate-dependent dioxygenase 11-like isoform X1 [Rhododendron vialii]|uniref:2-oxoglutarate-dependent dioxygenase 11-like isoform X1 n=1 Tax=Rhododendron vialii TaxID=182163 RepID=UPI00265DB117|nr:2-oxoglutarate-dependent dioxygenase 11-like isoform X1 [Rhododendron vialii]
MENKEDGNCFHEVKITDQDGLLRTIKVPVVQQLALNGIKHLPDQYINVPPDHPVVSSSVPDPSQTFPAIDVAQLRIGPGLDGLGRAQELVKLARVAKDWGLFLIVNHGIEDSVLQSVEDVVRGFFGLSFEEKKLSVGTYMNVDNMGYGQNFVRSENQRLTWIDRLAMKAAPREASEGLLVWPQNPANFRQVMEQYAEEARKLCNHLLEALAESLSQEKHVFLENFDSENSEINVRVNYYPPCPRPDLALGQPPHSDASALTLLMQFGATGGLQVLKDAKWFTVPWPENTLLVSVWDLMEIMSNGRVKSSWHRVVTQADVERFSVALFYNPPPEAEIEPVEGEGPSDESYKKVAVGEYVRNSYKYSLAIDKQPMMNFAKN